MSNDCFFHKDSLGYYAVLELDCRAGTEAVKQNYRELAKKWHPDYNKADNALEIFQKLSVAYDVLQDENRRLIYDLLSCVYEGADFPELENIQPFKGKDGEDNIRVLNLQEIRGKLWTYSRHTRRCYCAYSTAVAAELRTSVLNWLLGWWSPQAFFKNIKALRDNFKHVNVPADNLKLLIHNAVAFYQNGKTAQAARSAIMAMDYASFEVKIYLQKFLELLAEKVSRPKRWNFAWLQIVQLIVPLGLIVAALIPSSVKYVTDNDLMSWFSEKKQIDYYQEVSFGGRGRSVDDVVVGKILSIPVDRSDITQLYHLKNDNKIMYGPSEDFDVLKVVPAQTTVRLTGISPDKIWARILIDNGEMGFVKMDELLQGIGKPVPDFSKVYQAQ